MNNEQITNKENGRSMVEMLGVLAVVGVLSIGALAGYVYGMDKYRANEVLNSVSQMAIIGTQQRALNPTVTIDLHEFNNKTVYPFEVVTEGVEEGQFAIRFRNIPEGTCKRLLSASKEFVAAADIDVNGVQIDTADVSCADGDTNAFIYYFDDAPTGDETGGSGGGGDPVTPPVTCTSPLVQVRGCDGSLTPCCPDTADCTQPTDCSCTDDSKCYGDQSCVDGVCQCPESWGETGSLGADGATCCSSDGYKWDPDGGLGGGGAYEIEDPGNCGCPGTIGTDGTTCCVNNLDFATQDVAPTICGCPGDDWSGTGLPTPDGTACCKDGFKWDPHAGFGGSYSGIDPKVCGCPRGGSLGTDGTTCCSDGKAIDGSGYYSIPNITVCGCPGTIGTDGTTCCVNYSDFVTGNMTPTICGCPDGGSPTPDGTTCCKNGHMWGSGGYVITAFATCGCPDGGSFGSDGTSCCKDGAKWGGWGGYSEVDIAACGGCPSGGSPGSDGTTCCKDGVAYDSGSYAYYSEACGTPTFVLADNTWGSHFDLTDRCPSGYHWASHSEAEGNPFASDDVWTSTCADSSGNELSSCTGADAVNAFMSNGNYDDRYWFLSYLLCKKN